MTNFLKETLVDLNTYGYTYKNVVYIGNKDYGCTWQSFERLANFDYDPFTNDNLIPYDLQVRLDDGSWLEREKSMAYEGWIHRIPWSIPTEYKEITRLVARDGDASYLNLSELNIN